ncbi:histidine kinase [Subsaxibacter sp. CAU 1640]|uniref:ligand-binding sensor domain-containing protein n=1 Tax=Subsaxibacter sp. CAU 1640 TaxID=2933271 RepID=UPI0020047FCC|nr:two-component regulator propeller domain-containing protein [Subsaxibacter sp. CAU 1640]MCK7589673.1 histidine kinase [Subsaxibacter sp. CAU 1640]
MTISFRAYLFFLILVNITFTAFCQNNELRSYTLEDGLPQSQVYAIVQDDIGYLWLGTQGGGLARFDGENFKIFDESDGLESNYVNDLFFAKDSLFIATRRGLSIRNHARFDNYSLPEIITIFGQNGQNYFGTKTGIYRFSKNNDVVKLKFHSLVDEAQINSILFDGSSFWIASNKGLFKCDTLAGNAVVEVYDTHNFTSLVQVDSKLIASTFINGILVLDLNSKKEVWIEELQRINSLSLIKNQLWVSSDNDGFTVLDVENFQIQKQIGIRSGLTVSHIRECMTDNQGSIWIATSGGGLYKYFQNEFIHFDKDTGLNGNRVYAVHNATSGLWISNSEEGLVKIDGFGIHPIEKIQGFNDVKIKTIASDDDGNIWSGSDGKGLVFRQTTTRDSLMIKAQSLQNIQIDTIKVPTVKNHLFNTSNGFPSDWIRQILVRNDTVWVATYSDGIVKMMFDKESSKINILKIFGQKEGISDLLLKDMKVDGKGRIWYSTQNGHLGYIENNNVNELGQVLEDKTAINSLVFKNNLLFLGTAGNGVWMTDIQEKMNLKKLSGDKSLTSKNIYQLIFDNENHLWVGSEKGVDKVVLNQEQKIVDVFHFGRNDGFLGIETCLNAVDIDNEGNLWFGALYGLTKYEATQEQEETSVKPKIDFESIEVAYKPIDSLSYYTSQSSERILQLDSNQNQISFTYRTVDINHPKDIEYRFKLNDGPWSPWSESNQQNLAGLGYGTHTFMVQSRNYRWEQSEPIAFSFFIETPLYQKVWFQWLVIATVLLIVLWFVWNYLKRIKRKNSEEKARLELQNHLLSLEHKALQLQMNPHFIFNVLNGIKAMGESNPQKMNTTVNTFATLLREILNNSRKDTITLEQEIKTLTHYIEVEQLMSSKPFQYEIEVESDIDKEEILIPPMLIQPFVENAIRHGILKGSREGELKVIFKVENEWLKCTIIDNGLGIFYSQNSKTATDHQSMALTVTKERIESLAGKDTLMMEEIKSNDLILGTKISFQIPLKTDF